MPRRRRCVAPSPIPGEERPVQRNAANARERARMRVLSKAFCRLKTTLPWVPADTKLSKLDTLRLATSYIAHLRAVLTDEAAEVAPLHPLNLTWPFSFQQQSQGSVHPQGQQGWQETRDWTPSSLERGANSTDHDMDDDDDEEDEEEPTHRHHSTYHHHHHHHHHQFSDSLLHLG